jgi:bacteriorhodopsin
MEDVAQVMQEELVAHGRVGEGMKFVHQGLSGTGYLFVLIGLVCMAGSTAYFYMCAMKKSGDAQFFEGLTMMITGIATVAYLTMFSGVGRIYVHDRKFFYARYIDWILTTPLMIWDILAIAGASNSEIMLTCGIDMLMIGFGVVGGATPGYKKWIFWVIACLCFMHVVGVLMKYMSSEKYGAAAKKLYGQVAWLTIVLWTFYPIAWVLAEGGHMVSCTAEAGIYMVLDVLSKCMFGFVIVSARGALDSISNEKAGYNSVA